jgi:undecaprenyl-diphosphatase
MSFEEILKVILLGIVEGVTEFLPISSTGHLIVATRLLGYPPENIRDTFDIFIQLGAIIAVVVYYARDLLGMARKFPTDRTTQRFWLYVFVAFLPAAAIGFVFRSLIKEKLFDPTVVGISLIVGGLIFLWIERKPRISDVKTLETITFRHALIIGLAQVTALIPGVSRSGASIVGGLLGGLDRVVATKFSFYLAIPTLGIATLYELYTAVSDGIVTSADLPPFVLGTVVSFVVAWASIAWLLNFVSKNSFRPFGFFRIAIGVVIIIMARAFNLT